MKALVIGSVGDESHEESVRTYFLAVDPSAAVHIAEIGTGTPSGNIVTYQTDIAGCVAYAIANSYNIIIRSYTGIYNYKVEWDEAIENGIAVYHAHGSNAHELLASPPRMFGAIAIGGGKNNINERSYGKMERFDKTAGDLTEESWATPTSAARGALIQAEYPTFNLWDIRALQRMVDSYYETAWVEDGGYGQGSAIIPVVANANEIDLQPPLETWAQKSGDNKTVSFLWENFIQTRWNKTRIVRADTGATIYEGTGTSATFYSDVDGNLTFKFYSVDAQGNLSRDESYSQINITGLEVYQLTAPTNIQGIASQEMITLSWDSVSLAEGYQIERKKVSETTWGVLKRNSPELTIVDNGLKASTAYQYRIKAKATQQRYVDSNYNYVNMSTLQDTGDQKSVTIKNNSLRFGNNLRANEASFGQPENIATMINKYLSPILK
jgi:hypothetical protein